ncbi:MAG: glycoside hydrolase family 15 protein, partial [Streptosporangiales bacterium]|nr:glycoside hydrolase family 15 protein [Streptosporangiales bacterium]
MGRDPVDIASMFPPQVLRQYALLADGERGALIGPHGDIAWMCAPRWHSDAVFSTLIGGGGAYVVTPCGTRHVWGGYYESGGLIWRSRWITTEGAIECREALAYPGDPGRVILLRQVAALHGDAKVRVLLEPRARFGHYANGHLSCHDGVWTGRTGPLRWRWTGAADAVPVPSAHGAGEVLVAELVVPEGERHDLVFEIADELAQDLVDPRTSWAATEATWARGHPDLHAAVAQRDAGHAWAVLRGLTSTGGGTVAAVTMSLPERAGANRSYDYRYAWIRDQSYAGLAAAAAGATDLLDRSTGFITARLLADGPRMRPAYTVTGDVVPGEEQLGLPGYPGGTDKVGNWVNRQFQLDAFGEALQLLAAAARLDRLDADGLRAIQVAVDVIGERWRDAEAGIWELDDRCWTQSRLACVSGLRAVAERP